MFRKIPDNFIQEKQAKAKTCNFTKRHTPWVFFTFLNCANGTKSRNASQIDLNQP